MKLLNKSYQLLVLLISVLMIFAAIPCTLIFSASANTEDYFLTASNWKAYDYASGAGTVGAAATANTAITFTKSTATKGGATVDTIYTRARGAYVTIPLQVTEKNTEYTFTFDYYFAYDSNDNTKDVLTFGGIMAADGSAVDPLTDDDANYLEGTRFTGTTTAENKVWKSKSFTFNSGEHTEILFVARVNTPANTLSFANLKLTYVTPTPTPPVTTYYETNSNWKAYGTGTCMVGAAADNEHKYGSTDNSLGFFNLEETVKNNSDYSIKTTARNAFNVIKLSDIKANTEYTLTFDYYYSAFTSVNNNKDPLEASGIIAANNTAVNAGVSDSYIPGTYTTRGSTYTVETWHTKSFDFNSGANPTEILLVLRLNSAPTIVYIDNVVVTEKPAPPETTYFETKSNWKAYAGDPGEVGASATEYSYGSTGISAGFFTLNDDVTNNSDYSIKSTARAAFSTVTMPILEPNTEYTFTFDWCYTNTAASKSPFEFAGIVAPNGLKLAAGIKGNYLPTTFYDRNDGSTYSAGNWYTKTLTFNSGEHTEILFVMRTNSADDIYFDNLTLNKVPPMLPVEKKVIDFETPYYIDPASKMGQVTTGGINNGGALKVPERTDGKGSVTYLNYSPIAIDKNDKVFRTAVIGGETYKITFKVKFNGTTKSAADKLMVYYDYYGYYEYGNYDTKDNINYSEMEIGEWIEFKRYVTVLDNQDFIAFAFNAGTVHPEFYMDDIIIERVDVPDWNATPVKEKIVDFETDTFVSAANRIVQQETGGIDNSGCLRLPKRNTSNGEHTFLNYIPITINKTDPVYRTAVKPNSAYKVAIKVKFSEAIKYEDGKTNRLFIWVDYYSNNVITIEYSKVKTGEWLTYYHTVLTDENQTEIGFAIRAGHMHPEIFFDDLTITEIDKFHTTPKEKTVIDFEQKDLYSFEQPERMEIAETEGHNGEKTNALHIKQNDFSDVTATFTNWNTAIYGKDYIYSVPVKPKTNYHFSVWIRVDKPKDNSVYAARVYTYADYDADNIKASFTAFNYNLKDLQGGGWKKYEWDFLTSESQRVAKFAFNANSSHPDIWIDDITYSEIPVGYISDTAKNYCEDFFNQLPEKYKDTGKITKQTVFKVPILPNTRNTLGVTLKGSGMFVLAFDENGENIIRSISASENSKRFGFEFISGETHKYVYVIFKPTGNGLAYEDLQVFATKAVSLGYDMGYEEDPNIYYPVAVWNEGAGNGEEDLSDSPKTGEGSLTLVVLLLLVTGLTCFVSSKNKIISEKI